MLSRPPKIDRDAFLRPFLAEGFSASEPGLLFPADLFIDLSGEDLGKRLFLTSDSEGRDLCLRPELTIPVCVEYLAGGTAGRRADYAYFGRAFRHRSDGPDEFWQGGVEALGSEDLATEDARILKYAIDCAARHGAPKPFVRLGDVGLFRAVLEALDLPSSWRRKLARDFGRSALVNADLASFAARKPAKKGRAGLIAALDRADPQGARALVADLLALGGLSPAGGRGVDEIAERFLERAEAREAEGAANHEHLALLQNFLAIEAPPAAAAREAARLLAPLGKAVASALSSFNERLAALEKNDLLIGEMRFSAAFGRRLDYYSGFVFELYQHADRREPPLIGGGRYDKLLALLGAEKPVPAIGFSLWVERLEGESK